MNTITGGAQPALSTEELKRLARVMKEISGIEVMPEKSALVQARLARRLRETQSGSFAAYCKLIEDHSNHSEREELLFALTTNVTRFFREIHHFDHLKSIVLPALYAQAKRGNPIRMWSAAASTGEEPYSIAMTIAQAWPEFEKMDIKILATDIDKKVIQTCKMGMYSVAADANPVPPEYRHFFNPPASNGKHEVAHEIRSMVTFNTMNLNGEWPMKGKFDAVFCRNVTIYFDRENENRIWRKISNLLKPNSYLYIGHSERVENSEDINLKISGATTYMKV